jgi:membrane protease YdiL (CAAX protease family)
VLYLALLGLCLWGLGAALHGWAVPLWMFGAEVAVGVAGMVLVGRRSLQWLVRPRLSLRGASYAAGTLAVAYASANAVGVLLPTSDELMLAGFRDQAGGLWLALLAIAIVTPVLEEWIFRGALLELVLVVFPREAATIVCALLFAFMHLTPQTIVHHGLLGYLCGRVRIETGSLWPAILCHAAYNAAVVLALW